MAQEKMGINEQASWPIQSLGWLLIGAWFCGSLISQVMYMSVYGTPYGPEILLAKLGPVYWLVGGLELIFWALLGNVFIKKLRKKKANATVI